MDNQPQQPQFPQSEQPQQPLAPEPMSPQSQFLPPEEPQKSKKKYLLIGTGVLVALLVIAGGVLTLNRSSGNGGVGTIFKKEFPDWLQPKDDIKIGSFRYVSPCQALPQDELTKLYGNFGDAGYVMEDYLDQSSTEKTREVRARCSYEIDNETVSSVELKTTQYRDLEDMKLIGSVMGLVDVEDAEKALAEFKQIVGDSDNKDAQKLVERFTTSTATYKKYDKVYNAKDLTDLKTDGLLVPSDSGVTLVQGNVAYVFSYRPKPVEERPSASQLVDYVARINKTMELIEKNAKDPSLSQSPARTVLGETDMIGSTRLLESCAVLTPAIFKSVTTREQNDTIHRLSTVYDPNKDRFAKADKSLLLPYNSCEREYSRYNDATSTSTTPSMNVSLDLQHAKSEQAAKDYLVKYFPLEAGDVALSTRADWAQQMPMQDLLDANKTNNLYIFRVGPYILKVNIRQVVSEGLRSEIIQSEGTSEQHVQAINELTDSLRAHLKKATE